ncbi:MAG: hypothetical protein K8R21_10245, partial [Leptospira sp.]|nr:hypothetical protein [Leptospira sp.]
MDAGDTLIHLRENAGKIYYEILKSHGVVRSPDDSENVRKFFSEAWIEVSKKNPENHRDRYTGHPEGNEGYWRELIEIFLSKLDKTGLTDAVYHSILEKFDNPDTWMVDPTFYVLSEFLQKSGIGLGLISNWDLRLRGLLTRLQLLDHFKYLII